MCECHKMCERCWLYSSEGNACKLRLACLGCGQPLFTKLIKPAISVTLSKVECRKSAQHPGALLSIQKLCVTGGLMTTMVKRAADLTSGFLTRHTHTLPTTPDASPHHSQS